MSEQPQGPGWWLASDGKYYPPQTAPAQPDAPYATQVDEAPRQRSVFGRWWFWLIVVVVVIFVVAAGACGVLIASVDDAVDEITVAATEPDEDAASPTLSLAETDEQGSEEAESPEPEPEPEPEFDVFKTRTFKGTGDDVIRLKQVVTEPVLVVVTHTGGDSNVVVDALNARGEQSDLLANGIGGQFRSTAITNVYEGESIAAMEVRAPGSWTIKLKDLSTARQWDGEGALKGQWDDVVLLVGDSFAPLDGLRYNARGDSNFVVEAFTASGDIDLVVNDIAPARGEGLMPPDPVLLEIRSGSGPWTLRKASD